MCGASVLGNGLPATGNRKGKGIDLTFSILDTLYSILDIT